jgi:hypothetical protein
MCLALVLGCWLVLVFRSHVVVDACVVDAGAFSREMALRMGHTWAWEPGTLLAICWRFCDVYFAGDFHALCIFNALVMTGSEI